MHQPKARRPQRVGERTGPLAVQEAASSSRRTAGRVPPSGDQACALFGALKPDLPFVTSSFVIPAENSVLASTSRLNKDKFRLSFFVPNVERPAFKRFPQRILHKDAQAILF